MASRLARFLAALPAIVLITACGGGGGGTFEPSPPPPSPPPPPTGFEPGVFAPEENFRARCQSPRTGTNPATNRPYVDVQGTTLDENNFLRSYSNRTYLWYDEITDRDPAGFTDPLDYFEVLKTNELSPTGAPKDKFHFTFDSFEYFQLSQGGVSAGYGAEWAVLSAVPPREIRVAYTEPNSPATDNGLLRGALILEIDGFDINTNTQAGVDALNAGLSPGSLNESHDFTIQDPDGTVRTVTLVSEEITNAMVQNTRVINTPTGDVGYMTFNYHRSPAEQELIDAINTLNAGGGIDDLVLDLRYNGGGFLDIAGQLAYMIAGRTATLGRNFETLQFNDKYPTTNPVTGAPITPTPFWDETLGFSVPEGQALPTLDLSRVFVLTGPDTCSASEAIMNGLRGIGVEVIQIGSTTCGKPYGFYAVDNCGTTYFTIQFRGVNDANYGDYTDGFTPAATDDAEANVLGCIVADDFSEQLGDANEDRLEVALAYRDGGTCITPASSVAPGEFSKVSAPRASDGAVLNRSPFDSNRILRQ